ncbi:lytic transglycosylase domain-containing protein [Variovorax paradoxus]|uniref:lytic transglycosylase domain-containing protein n=1 Tax=Variovorax paradoxus TaxID=34073 RepID=UPI0027D7CFB6|nr:lytic transglycosylase domain-containing protein [Variovorax paradoxus]
MTDAELMAAYKTAKDPFESALAAEGVTGKVADIARSIYQQESGSGKNTKTSNAGAVGGMQIIPPTFKSVADKDWDINDPTHNARAGIRYVKQLYEQAEGDPALTAAGYYGGPGGLEKARRGVAVADPRNPNAPTTLQYGKQVAARLPKEPLNPIMAAGKAVTDAIIPSANAAEPASPYGGMSDEELLAAYQKLKVGAPTAEAAPAPALEPVAGQPSGLERFIGGAVKGTKDLAGGLVRGAGSIGATLLAPGDAIQDAMAGRPLLATNKARRSEMDAGLQTAGVDTSSLNYGAGKLTSEIAGTAGTGNVLGAGAKAAGAGPKVVNALRSGGMTLGQPGGSAVGNLLTRAGAGATVGAASAGLVDPETAGTGALIGGALPVATQAIGTAGRAIGRTIAGKGMAPEVKALADRAADLGIDIPADRLVNSKPLNALASSLDYVPGSGRTATMSKMEDQLNTAVSRTFGQNSPNVTQALRKAGDELGGKFDKVLSQNTVKIDQQFLNDLADASQMASKELGSDGARIIQNQVDEILAKATQTGDIDGQAAYNIKKTLDRIGKRPSAEAFYAIDLKQKLMEALNRSLGPAEAEAFKTVRQQYGNMLSLEKIAQNGAEGGISIGRLANMKNINNPELQELADISAQFLKSREGAHGAAQRVGAGALTLGLTGPGGLAAGMATGRGANMLLNSNMVKNAVTGTPQSNRLLQFARSPEVEKLLYRAAPVAGSQ